MFRLETNRDLFIVITDVYIARTQTRFFLSHVALIITAYYRELGKRSWFAKHSLTKTNAVTKIQLFYVHTAYTSLKLKINGKIDSLCDL